MLIDCKSFLERKFGILDREIGIIGEDGGRAHHCRCRSCFEEEAERRRQMGKMAEDTGGCGCQYGSDMI